MPQTLSCLRRQPQQQRSQNRVNTILNAAASLLASHGPAATTITAVAGNTGLATGSIYEYFEDDRHLIGAIAERGLREIHVELADIMADASTPMELMAALSTGLRAFLRRYQDETGLRQALAFADADPELAAMNLQDTRRNAEMFDLAYRRIQPDASPQTSMLLITHLAGALAALSTMVDEHEAEQLTAKFEQLIQLSLGI